jgi:hypothetical protein
VPIWQVPPAYEDWDLTPYAVIFADEHRAALLRAALPRPVVQARNRAELVALTRRGGAVSAVFVDVQLLSQIDPERVYAPVVAVIDEDPANTAPTMVSTLRTYPWVSHVVTKRMLASSEAREQLALLIDRLAGAAPCPVLGPNGTGRVALLAQASRREPRLERIQSFFSKHGLSSRGLASVAEVYEELVMNALYDAPLEAGFFSRAVPRSEDVELPCERACEISYGVERGNAFMRVRDTFGSLTRQRLVEVLHRCTSRNVELDESRGGAGLGLWRVFKTASSVTITVVPGSVTDILVGLRMQQGKLSKELAATHLFFTPVTAVSSIDLDHGSDYLDHSVTLVGVTDAVF